MPLSSVSLAEHKSVPTAWNQLRGVYGCPDALEPSRWSLGVPQQLRAPLLEPGTCYPGINLIHYIYDTLYKLNPPYSIVK